MSQPQSASAQVLTGKIQVIVADNPAALAIATNTATNILNKALRIPAVGQTTGDVLNGTITVSPSTPIVLNNTLQYMCSINYQQFVTPA